MGVGDFLGVAILGAVAAACCAVVALEIRSHAPRAALGAVLSLLPVLLLISLLGTDDG